MIARTDAGKQRPMRAAQSNVNGAAQSDVNGAAQSNVNGAAQSNVNGAAQSNVNGDPDGGQAAGHRRPAAWTQD
jgi:hypothetical protein